MITLLLILGVALFGFMIVVAVVAEKKTIYVACINCGTRVGLYKGIGTCPKCGEALRVEQGNAKRIEAGFVPDNPSFNVRLSQLRHPSKWSTIWPNQCCICGRPAAREDVIKIKSVEGQTGSALTPVNITQTERFIVGYCSAHRDGIRFAFPPGYNYAKTNDQCLLALRSVDFYREFMKQNALRQPEEFHLVSQGAAQPSIVRPSTPKTTSKSREPRDGNLELLSMAELDALIDAQTTPSSLRESARAELRRRDEQYQ